VLERFDLADVADRRASTYSSGMRRRLDLAATLVGRPSVIFLDEPSTGLDPRSPTQLWEQVEELRSEGTTILLTTQYLDEADRLADKVAVIDHGRIVAEGTTEELKARVGGERVVARIADASRSEAAPAALAALAQDGPPGVLAHGELSLPVHDPALAADAVRALDAEHVRIAGLPSAWTPCGR
jgi:ABC-2 type transport system ATP-binding protein